MKMATDNNWNKKIYIAQKNIKIDIKIVCEGMRIRAYRILRCSCCLVAGDGLKEAKKWMRSIKNGA